MGRVEEPGHHGTRGARLADVSLGLGTGAASPPACPGPPPCSISFPCPQPGPWALGQALNRRQKGRPCPPGLLGPRGLPPPAWLSGQLWPGMAADPSRSSGAGGGRSSTRTPGGLVPELVVHPTPRPVPHGAVLSPGRILPDGWEGPCSHAGSLPFPHASAILPRNTRGRERGCVLEPPSQLCQAGQLRGFPHAAPLGLRWSPWCEDGALPTVVSLLALGCPLTGSSGCAPSSD